MKQCKCGSWAINLHLHGRDGSDDDLCDVCYWSTRAERLTRELAELKADRDSWIEQASQRAQETVEAMQQVEAYRLRCEAPHSAPREPLTDEQIANAARWRYWRNYWPALCRMEVARFAGLDLRTTYVQDPAGMDRVTDEAMTRRAHNSGADAPSKE